MGHSAGELLALAALALAASYSILTLAALIGWKLRRPVRRAGPERPPVTVLKPLCGAEPGLYENLRSFCEQDYPQFQLVFGVQDSNDAALLVVERVMSEFPSVPIQLVVSPLQHGSNRKVSNLINMLPRASHDILAISDSDACVGPDYLNQITLPLSDPRVGLVTCIYRGVPTRGIWSRLGAMYINEWYIPSVLLAWLFGHQGFASGLTLCLRRNTLRAIGGLRSLVDHLADDYRLGELVRGLGLRIELAPCVLDTEHHEPTLAMLTRHEMRWMRTLQVLKPGGFRCLFVTFSAPLALAGIALLPALSPLAPIAWTLFGVSIAGRVILHLAHRLPGERALFADLWLLPARDALVVWIWCRSFFTSRVTWRGQQFDVDAEGIMRTPS